LLTLHHQQKTICLFLKLVI